MKQEVKQFLKKMNPYRVLKKYVLVVNETFTLNTHNRKLKMNLYKVKKTGETGRFFRQYGEIVSLLMPSETSYFPIEKKFAIQELQLIKCEKKIKAEYQEDDEEPPF